MKRKTIGLLVGLAPLFIFAWGTTGCGGDHINLTLPDGDFIAWGESIRVSADIREQGNKPKDGSDVKFSLTTGSFEPYEEGRVDEAVMEIEAETTAGVAEVTVYSFPGKGSSGAIVASFETIGKKSLTESVPISIGVGGKPTGGKLSAQCDPVNVTAINTNGTPLDPEMRIRCTLTIKDLQDKAVPLPGTIETLVEGGCDLQALPEDNTGATHVFVLKADCVPEDVEPWNDEPNHMYAGKIHNPRDGLLTILFAVEGQEGFNDGNGNGIYDPGEGFVGEDQPEPFLDVNDNGEYDPGEPHIENNGNQQWDPPDGRWSDNVWISTSTLIMFTGPPHQSAETSHFSPPGINIEDGGNQTLTFYLMDENHNPIAANNASDQIDFNPDDLSVAAGETQDLLNVMGVTFFLDGSIDPQSLSADAQDSGRNFSINIEDRHPGDLNPYPVSLQPSVRYTPGVRFEGYAPVRVDVDLNPITGTAN